MNDREPSAERLPSGAGRTKPLYYPPETEAAPPSRPVIVLAFVAVVALAVLGYLLVSRGFDSDGDAGSPPPGQSGGSNGTSATSTVSSVVTLGPGRVLTASQHVVFDRPVDSITVSVPSQVLEVAGGFDPRIDNLQVLIGSQSPINVAGPLTPGRKVTVDLPTSVSVVNLAYVTYGAVHVSEPSSSHRAAALVTTLAVAPMTGVTTVSVEGPKVTNIGCFSTDGTATACGSQTDKGWTVMRESGDPDIAIIAQIDLLL